MGRKRKREEDYIGIGDPRYPEINIRIKIETFLRIGGVIAEMRNGDMDVAMAKTAAPRNLRSMGRPASDRSLQPSLHLMGMPEMEQAMCRVETSVDHKPRAIKQTISGRSVTPGALKSPQRRSARSTIKYSREMGASGWFSES